MKIWITANVKDEKVFFCGNDVKEGGGLLDTDVHSKR